MGKKRVKFEDAFWRSLLGVFWSIFGQFFIFFLALSTRKNREFTLFLCLWHPKKASDNMQETA